MGLTLTEWLQMIGAVIALLTFWKSVTEYIKQGTSKRAEQFLLMHSRFRENRDFQKICKMLMAHDAGLRDIPPPLEKDNFLAFYEELALLWNSGIFNDHVVYYTFGYYALECWRSKYFWHGLAKPDSPEGLTWVHFRDFAKKMEKLEKSGRGEEKESGLSSSWRKYKL